MTISTSQNISIQYPNVTVKRAQRALFFCVFQLNLFLAMVNDSIDLLEMVGEKGFKKGYTKAITSERKVERDLMWLIKVGLLRREVDGQGITDSFRLTPLGKQVIKQWEKEGKINPQPSFFDKIINFFSRIFSMFSI